MRKATNTILQTFCVCCFVFLKYVVAFLIKNLHVNVAVVCQFKDMLPGGPQAAKREHKPSINKVASFLPLSIVYLKNRKMIRYGFDLTILVQNIVEIAISKKKRRRRRRKKKRNRGDTASE